MVKKSNVSRRERRVKRQTEKKHHAKKRRAAYKKRQRNKKIFNYTILGLLVIGVAMAFYNIATSNDGDGAHDDLAQCLTEKGVIMYGTDWCGHCQAQKRAFGSSFRYVNYINCDLNSDACDLAGVTGYPTWVFPDGGEASGEQELSYLSERAGCDDAA